MEAEGPSPVVRKAIQATAATAVAVPVGMLISAQRWYWAAIGAFVVFTRATTAGESVERGLQRLVGTTIGAAVGIVLGTAVAGSTAGQLVLLVAGLFCTLYLFPASYVVAMAGMTTMLAVLYDLLGRFSDGVLELRVAETAVGVALGGLAALLILPMSTRAKVREEEDELVDELRGLLTDLADDEPLDAQVLRGRARAVEAKARELREAAEPLTGLLPGRGSGEERRRVVLFSSFGRSARRLADALAREGKSPDATLRRDLQATIRELAGASQPDDGPSRADGEVATDGPAGAALEQIIRTRGALDGHTI